MSARPPPPSIGSFPYVRELGTRWLDNDIYGHVNNVVYYSYFDTVIAHYLMEEGGLDPWNAPVVGFAVESGCRYHRPLAFPDPVRAGLRVAHIGRSSVRYEIGIFRADDPVACADGHFVHVFVDRAAQRPTAIPPRIRAALERLLRPATGG
jgi:acyl-CoA thioester hydrolase